MTELATRPEQIQLAIPGVELTFISLVVTDPELPFDVFEVILRAGGRFHSAAKFWLGDAINFGEKAYGERYAQAIDATGKSYSYLANIASVCRRIAVSRRKESLSFGHHEIVAPLEPHQQTEWLDAAEANEWSVDVLRNAVREAYPKEPNERPRFSENEPLATEPLTPDEVEEAEQRARKTLERSLPATHPLWETEAKALARDAVALAVTAKVTIPRDALERLVADATLIEVPPDGRDEDGNALVGLTLREPIYGVSCEALREVAALAGLPLGDLGERG